MLHIACSDDMISKCADAQSIDYYRKVNSKTIFKPLMSYGMADERMAGGKLATSRQDEEHLWLIVEGFGND